MMRTSATLLACSVWLVLLGGCSESKEPVGKLTVSPPNLTLGYPGFTPLELDFEMTAPLDSQGTPIVFVHVIDEPGEVMRTFDHPLPGAWTTGGRLSYEIDLHQSALAPPLAPGDYDLTVGLYEGDRRWALETVGEEVDHEEYRIATVTVPEGSENVPMFFFSPSWMATEGGTDAQILGRRWLTAEGVIRLAEISTPGVVRLSLRMPEPRPEAEDAVLDEGYTEPELVLTSTCDDGEHTLTGYGSHTLKIAVSADAEGNVPEECEISFEPHFRLIERHTLQARAAMLEGLSWGG